MGKPLVRLIVVAAIAASVAHPGLAEEEEEALPCGALCGVSTITIDGPTWDPCQPQVLEGTYVERAVTFPRDTDKGYFRIEDRADWDSVVCKNGELLEMGFNALGGDCENVHGVSVLPLGCVEEIEIAVEPDVTYLYRVFNYADPEMRPDRIVIEPRSA